ncbi:MAG TPA: GGDEF domain-containing protein [Thermoanaerobaculia bacterium]|nr:GGDEF domain-containing protein [Thermoanaerobaculia bacterium]
MTEQIKRGSQEFADIVPGRTTEVYLDVTERRTDAEHADERQPALVMLQGDLPGEVFRLQAGRQIIGRRQDCEIRLREKAVSGHHAEVVRTDAGVTVSDLQSTNGTVVNGRRIRNPVFLAQGSLLKLGNSVFKYVESLVEVELSESLHERATVDPVTGAANRARFLTRLAYLIGEASPARPVSVIGFELDAFSGVIASRGRAAADAMLHDVARIFRESYHGSGRQFGRIGDESFAIGMADLPLASAGAAAGTVRNALEAIGLEASIGVVATERPGDTAETLLARAEEMVARARQQGGHRIVLE